MKLFEKVNRWMGSEDANEIEKDTQRIQAIKKQLASLKELRTNVSVFQEQRDDRVNLPTRGNPSDATIHGSLDAQIAALEQELEALRQKYPQN